VAVGFKRASLSSIACVGSQVRPALAETTPMEESCPMAPPGPSDSSAGSAIERAIAQVEAARAQLVGAVACARDEGWSWARIGRTLGVSRQAAWERFHHHIEEPSGEQVGHLKRALETSRRISMAIGIVMASREVDREGAIHILQAASKEADVSLDELCTEMVNVSSQSRPEPPVKGEGDGSVNPARSAGYQGD